MSYLNTGIELPGISELLFYKGPTGKALSQLAQTILRGPSGLTSGEREMIASYVSKLNDCEFCHQSHSAAANAILLDGGKTINCLVENPETAPISNKMKALLRIAAKVQKSGKEVNSEDIALAKSAGATDEDIHDAVLVAAAFCMYNRYVDGLGTALPAHQEEYLPMGERLAKKGYKYPPLFLRKFVLKMITRKRQKKTT
ncbi:peroxidase-related enzyme [Echinicola sp. CAU 1574]|uniref:Peroxidase-related enzyme n=1 Tax=Echinicola arenosa TaxID=2774144 RepID=A0ABR9AJ86_9BACT|nr:peroxidase-related enzyme [Echinicola arenosa]MBD8488858.1 peroxidase-related enzyme [Echinicola arenosa]